jgi:hypothetical protein
MIIWRLPKRMADAITFSASAPDAFAASIVAGISLALAIR